jgi:hypothetical protein
VSYPAADAGFIAYMRIAELAFEVRLLASDHTEADDEIERHQRNEQPGRVEGNWRAR